MPDSGELKFRAVLEDSFDVVTVIDLDGTIRPPAPAFERVLGYPPGEVEGRPIFDFIHPADLPKVRAEFERSLARPGPGPTIEARLIDAQGGVRVMRGRGRSFVHDPAVRGIVLVMRDVTGERGEPSTEPPLDRFVVPEEDGSSLVPASRVDWIESAGDYVCLHVGDRIHLIRDTLAELEERLAGAGFARIHRSTIVNLARVRGILPRRYGDRTVVLEGGERLRMSRTYRRKIEERLGGRL